MVLVAFVLINTSAAAWTHLKGTPLAQNAGSAITIGRPDTLFAMFGGSAHFYRYVISHNTWTQLADCPAAVGTGGAMTADTVNGVIYAIRGGGTSDFWVYGVASNSWSTSTSLPVSVTAGGSLAYDYRSGYYWIYAIVGGGDSSFFRYGPSGAGLLDNVKPNGTTYNWYRLPYIHDDSGAFHATTGACIAQVKDSVFCIPAASSRWRWTLAYSITANTWHRSKLLLSNDRPGPGCAIAVFNNAGSVSRILFVLLGYESSSNKTRVRERNVDDTAQAWYSRTATPKAMEMGASVTCANDGWFYAFFGNGDTVFAKLYYYNDVPDGGQTSALTPASDVALRALPNPLTTTTSVSFAIPLETRCRLTVYRPTGEPVCRLLDGIVGAGKHSITWNRRLTNGQEAPAGIYLMKLEAGLVTATQKVVIE